MEKSRNAPIKTASIPRLKLQEAVLAARVDLAVQKELNFDFERAIFWTESMITLNYIRDESRRFQTYVANRVAERYETSRMQISGDIVLAHLTLLMMSAEVLR